jgi:hypothetical protein
MESRPLRALAPVLVLASAAGPLPAGPLFTGGGPATASDPADEALLERVLDRAQAELEERLVLVGDHARWETAWRIETRDYEVRTSLNWYIGRKLGDDLEAMLGFFRELGRTQWRPPQPMNVFLFPSLAEYNAFGNEHGQEHSSMLGSFWASAQADRPVALYFDSNRLRVSMWATHSAFHQFSGQAFPTTPELWLDEGLASYFAIFFWDAQWGATEFRRVVDTGRFTPLRQLMREPIAAWVDDPDARFVQLGALFTYLLNYREDTRTQKNAEGVVLISPAADYVSDLLRGRDVSDHPVHELFTTRLDELEADLRAFQF